VSRGPALFAAAAGLAGTSAVGLAGLAGAGWWPAALIVIATAAAAAALLRRPLAPGVTSTAMHLIERPELLARRRQHAQEELAILEDAQELQRGVFEVSAELVGCVEEPDARHRFAAAMRRYWACTGADLLVWERGEWRSLGGPASGAAPTLNRPVLLPAEAAGDLILDLSPGVAGQACLVLRQACPQPSLDGRNPADQRYVAEVLRGQLALSLRRVMLYGELQALARTDPLTGTHRRWYGEHRLRELVEGGAVVAVAMVDIDHFKAVNDAHGHAAGDQVLAAVGAALRAQVRTGDLVCRMGGEEFLAILPDSSLPGAEQVANRLNAAVAALAGLPSAVTVSVGVAACHQDDDVEALLARADQVLYQAKADGRNRVVVALAPGEHLRTRTIRRARSE